MSRRRRSSCGLDRALAGWRWWLSSAHPPAGVDVLVAVGAGVALGAGAGGLEGGAIVGFGFGAADVGAAAGLLL
jgi:hypothetical protein